MCSYSLQSRHRLIIAPGLTAIHPTSPVWCGPLGTLELWLSRHQNTSHVSRYLMLILLLFFLFYASWWTKKVFIPRIDLYRKHLGDTELHQDVRQTENANDVLPGNFEKHHRSTGTVKSAFVRQASGWEPTIHAIEECWGPSQSWENLVATQVTFMTLQWNVITRVLCGTWWTD